MGSDLILDPPSVKNVFEEMRENQEQLNQKRLAMIETLR